MSKTTDEQLASGKWKIKCGCPNGRYYYNASEHGPCYSCSGKGYKVITAAAYAKLEADRTRAIAWQAEEAAVAAHEERAYQEASDLISREGIVGARKFFTRCTTGKIDLYALGSLVMAMRDGGDVTGENERHAPMHDAANKLVQRNSELARGAGPFVTAQEIVAAVKK